MFQILQVIVHYAMPCVDDVFLITVPHSQGLEMWVGLLESTKVPRILNRTSSNTRANLVEKHTCQSSRFSQETPDFHCPLPVSSQFPISLEFLTIYYYVTKSVFNMVTVQCVEAPHS